MVLMLINIQSWLQKPKVWRFVCFFSSVVGLLCYAFSSSFNNLFGKWIWWKILLYIGFSFIICLTVLFAKVWECSTSPRVEAHMAFFILMITSVYSFFFDKEVKGKPDAYSLVSCAAFAIMSLALARLSHFGFEVDLLHFFSGVLTIQLMKIKLWLVIVGGSFSYSLIILRSTLDAHAPRSEYHGLQDRDHHHVVIEFGSHSQSQGTRTSPSATQVDSPQAIVTMAQEPDSPPENEDQGLLVTQSQGNSDSEDNSTVAKFMSCIDTLKKENGNLILTIFKHVDEYLKDDYVIKDQHIQLLKLHKDDNLVVDSLPSGIIKDLCESTRQMVKEGLEEECLHAYSSCRREFLCEILSALKELNMEDIDEVAKMRHTIKAMWVANRIVIPNERRLCEKVFEGFIHREDLHPALPGIDALRLWKNPVIPGIDKVRLWESIGIGPPIDRVNPSRFEDLTDLLYLTYGVKEQATVAGGRIHRISIDVLDYIEMIYQNWQGLFKTMVDKERKLSLYGHIAMITDLLDSSLEAISKNYNDPTLGYLFIINNRKFIELTAKRRGLRYIFGDDWLQKNTAKFQQNLELYQRSSWSKILNILKLDINESEPNVAVELMRNKLRSFNEHLDDICNTQATWFVFNEKLREQMIKSIENILLPAYGNFIDRLQDFLGNQAYKYIKHGLFEIQDRLNNLFLVRDGVAITNMTVINPSVSF